MNPILALPLRLLLATSLLLPVACTTLEPDPEPPTATPGPVTRLRVEPADAVLAIAPGGTATLAYTAIATHADGQTEEDVSEQVLWGVDDAGFGMFTGSSFEAYGSLLGTTTVRALLPADQIEGSTSLSIRVEQSFLAPNAPSDAADEFGGAMTGTAPTLVYPEDGVVLPPNLRPVDVHWLPGDGNTLFALHFFNDGMDITVYTPCPPVGNGCVLDLPESAISALVYQAPGQQGASTMLQLEVLGVNPGQGGAPVGVSAPRSLGFSSSDLEGALYYWNAPAGAVMRVNVGTPGATPQLFYGPGQAGGICVGCHTVSRDGSMMAAGINIPAPAGLKVVDVATSSLLFEGASNFQTFSPDNSMLAWVDTGAIRVSDAQTGAAVFADPIVSNGTMPEWSPDGLSIVFSKAESACNIPFFCGYAGVDSADLWSISYDPMTGSFGAEEQLTDEASPANHYYPTISPDNAWVAYNRSFVNSYDAPDAELWLVEDASGATPVYLEKADGPKGNSWPKWAPFLNSFGDEPLMWLAFSSRRDYGLRIVNSSLPVESQIPQLWMAAVTPGVAGDPSYASFRLPQQDPASGNHIPQWATSIVGDPGN